MRPHGKSNPFNQPVEEPEFKTKADFEQSMSSLRKQPSGKGRLQKRPGVWDIFPPEHSGLHSVC